MFSAPKNPTAWSF